MHKLLALVVSAFLLLPQHAHALSSNWQRDGAVDVRLISAYDGVGQKPIIPLGFEVRMEPGWHTYWRSPGAVGLPPQFDWTNSLTDQGNLRQATILYPAPKRYSDQGMDSIGYKNRVIFPIDAELRQTGVALNIKATVNLLVCSDLCVPKTFTVNLKIPSEAAIEGAEADELAPFRAQVPTQDASTSGLSIKNIVNHGNSLTFELASDTSITSPDVFIESNPEIPFGAPEWKPSDGLHGATLTVKPSDVKQNLTSLANTPITVTVVNDKQSVEVATVIPADPNAPKEGAALTLRVALILAIIGGFLLNLMPCVLPVLSLKILSVVSHGGGHASDVRRSFLTTAAGIMFSFVLLALMTVILKKLGMTLGWGVQFQQPLFLIILILLLSVFAANMWGLFEINLPRGVLDKLSAHHPKMAGDFATGALATLLATPCTAPFLGTAVGFALASGSSYEIIAIFIALGFGMIIPYFTIALIPEIATYLPKPGAWMLRLRWALGVALALTAVWLLWVLSAQIETRYALTVAACMVGVIAMCGFYTYTNAHKIALVGLAGFAIIAIGLSMFGAPPPDPDNKASQTWQPFNEAAIGIQVASGHIVFVDITADWCLTCKANKKFVLLSDDISQRLFHSDVVAMQGDWTNPDPDITNFLHKYRRYGIPFNVVYGPGAPQGITLPELLTHDVVVEALDRARGG